MMWISGLHIPESYLTALVQATCRENGWPLDKSTLYTSVTSDPTPEEVTEHASQGELHLLTFLSVFLFFTQSCHIETENLMQRCIFLLL